MAVNNATSTINGQQPSGFFMMQADLTSSKFRVSNWFGIGVSSEAHSMSTAYGFSSTASLETFVYAAQIDAKLVIPKANLAGSIYTGTMRLSQLVDTNLNDADQGVSIANLIRGADDVRSGSTSFTLSSAIVNDYITTHSLKSGQDTTLGTYLSESEMGAEVVTYAVLVTPAINITTGTQSQYTMISEISANAIVVPSISDFLLYKSFPTLNHHKQTREMDYSYSPIPKAILDKYGPPKTRLGLTKLESEMPGSMIISPATSNEVIAENPQPSPLIVMTKRTKETKTEEENDPNDLFSIGLMSRKKSGIIITFMTNRKLYEN